MTLNAPRSVAPDRRSLLRAGVWGAPSVMLASAAPAFAGSPGAADTAVFMMAHGAATDPSKTQFAVSTTTSQGAAVTMTIAVASYEAAGMGPHPTYGSGANLHFDHQVIGTSPGGDDLIAVTLHQYLVGQGSRGHYVLTFSREVASITFTVAGVSSLIGQDAALFEAGGGFVKPAGSKVYAVGSSGSVFVAAAPGASTTEPDDPMGKVEVRIDGPTRSVPFMMYFANGMSPVATSDTSQLVYFGDVSVVLA